MSKINQSKSRNPKGAGRKPGSVSAATLAIRKLASGHAEAAIKALIEVMSDSELPPAARVSAANALLDRGYGKPSNIVAVDFDPPLSKQEPTDALAAITDKITAGELPIAEGAKLSSMVETRMRAIELAELDNRLKALEGK